METEPDELDPWESSPKLPHSRLGLVCFALALLGQALTWGAGFLIAAVAVHQTAQEDKNEEIFQASVTAGGVAILVGLALSFLAIPVGLFGITRNNRRHVFTYAGLALSAICGLVLIGFGFFTMAQVD
jgi:hypothetical protein